MEGEGYWEPIRYHNVLALCSFCHKLGHTETECKKKHNSHIPSKKTIPARGDSKTTGGKQHIEFRQRPVSTLVIEENANRFTALLQDTKEMINPNLPNEPDKEMDEVIETEMQVEQIENSLNISSDTHPRQTDSHNESAPLQFQLVLSSDLTTNLLKDPANSSISQRPTRMATDSGTELLSIQNRSLSVPSSSNHEGQATTIAVDNTMLMQPAKQSFNNSDS